MEQIQLSYGISKEIVTTKSLLKHTKAMACLLESDMNFSVIVPEV